MEARRVAVILASGIVQINVMHVSPSDEFRVDYAVLRAGDRLRRDDRCGARRRVSGCFGLRRGVGVPNAWRTCRDGRPTISASFACCSRPNRQASIASALKRSGVPSLSPGSPRYPSLPHSRRTGSFARASRSSATIQPRLRRRQSASSTPTTGSKNAAANVLARTSYDGLGAAGEARLGLALSAELICAFTCWPAVCRRPSPASASAVHELRVPLAAKRAEATRDGVGRQPATLRQPFPSLASKRWWTRVRSTG